MTVQQLAQTNSFTIQYEDAFPSAVRFTIPASAASGQTPVQLVVHGYATNKVSLTVV